MKTYYLDNAATTRMFKDVCEKANTFLYEDFYNPSAVYSVAVKNKKMINDSKKTILKSLMVDSGDVVFTGSATEANNMAIFSQRNSVGKKYLFGEGEHPSVYECAKELIKKGYNVEFIPLDKNGMVDLKKYKELVSTGDVAFISVQHVSNETGAINQISKLVKLARKFNKNVLFHSDGVQAFMKYPYSLLDLDVDYYTISAHKIYGLKGVGALYVKRGVKVNPLILGGGQENGLRSGTENIFGIASFKFCIDKLLSERENNYEKVKLIRESLIFELKNIGVDIKIHAEGIHYILSVCLSEKVRGETLVHALEKRGIYISTGSACSATKHLNRTLESMGVPAKEILSSVRISFSPYECFDAKEIALIIKEELIKLEEKRYE